MNSKATPSKKPSKQDLLAAKGKTLPDVISAKLKVLFVGINPGLYTAAIGHHFGRPGNRFWPALHLGGFTKRKLFPYEEREILKDGYGITNVVPFATATAAELTENDFVKGGAQLEKKIKKVKPKVVAFLGVGAYRSAFHRPKAPIGKQKETIGSSQLWVLPNPSGLNANYQLDDLGKLFRQVYKAVH